MLFRRTRTVLLITVLLPVLWHTALFVFSGFPLEGITAYANDAVQIPVKVLIVPKFEIGDVTGDFPGEAQLFYEHYCTGCEASGS